MVRVIRFQPPPIVSGMTGWKLRTFCVLPRSPTPKSTLSWNGTLIRSAIGFCACFASASVPPPAPSARAWPAASATATRPAAVARRGLPVGERMGGVSGGMSDGALVAVVAARPGALERGRDVPRSRGRLRRRLLGVLTLVLDAPGHRGAPFQVAPAAAILREPLLRRRRAGRQRGGQADEDQPARTGAHPQRLELHRAISVAVAIAQGPPSLTGSCARRWRRPRRPASGPPASPSGA